ncbi:hypothetical protein E5288_WYG013476 [Bos mutus]|uniref:Uncharacterized protein n=1 Tax=Bos mutus TaxID=72004 RepID=A0A6B0S1U7_9CETA|nr:hypothetical protein [Bos mutus]
MFEHFQDEKENNQYLKGIHHKSEREEKLTPNRVLVKITNHKCPKQTDFIEGIHIRSSKKLKVREKSQQLRKLPFSCKRKIITATQFRKFHFYYGNNISLPNIRNLWSYDGKQININSPELA